MIAIRTFKQYWDAYLTRIPDIKHVFLVYNESDLGAKIRDIKANVPILLVIVPSADGTELDKDAIFDSNSLLLYVVCKQDNTSLTAAKELDVMETTQDILFGIEYFLHYDATTCGALLHEELQYINFSSRHIDPERNYMGCNGWSLSLQLADSNFLNDHDYDADALKVTITDGVQEVKKDVGEAYTCVYGNTPATVIDNGVKHDVMPGNEYTCEYGPAADGEVHNSDDSISLAVPSGGSVEFPDGELTEFDGSKTPLIAGKNVSAKVPDNTIITNSEHTELLNLSPGQSGELDDITVTNPVTGETYPYPAAKNLTESLGKKIKLVYKATYDDTQDYDITAEEAGTYTGATLVNCTAVYKINDVVSSLPLTFVNTNKYTATITRINAALDASVTINT